MIRFLLSLIGMNIWNCISFIGFSNIGKSVLAEKLKELGYTLFCVDDEIEKDLEPYRTSDGYTGTEGVSLWMGQPYDKRYAANSALYLRFEKKAMWSAFWRIIQGEKLLVDTTGSVIYCGWTILFLLRALSTVVLLNTPDSMLEEQKEKYFVKLKPVLWGKKGEIFRPLPGEEGKTTQRRCYPVLQATRNVLYHEEAHLVLEPEEFRSREIPLERVLATIKRKWLRKFGQ